jgi:hypothetical protein
VTGPEDKARETIDDLLKKASWRVVNPWGCESLRLSGEVHVRPNNVTSVVD